MTCLFVHRKTCNIIICIDIVFCLIHGPCIKIVRNCQIKYMFVSCDKIVVKCYISFDNIWLCSIKVYFVRFSKHPTSFVNVLQGSSFYESDFRAVWCFKGYILLRWFTSIYVSITHYFILSKFAVT